VFHKDTAGVLAAMAQTLSSGGYNIGNLRLSRTKREGDVITIIETDALVDALTADTLRALPNVMNVVSIPRF